MEVKREAVRETMNRDDHEGEKTEIIETENKPSKSNGEQGKGREGKG